MSRSIISHFQSLHQSLDPAHLKPLYFIAALARPFSSRRKKANAAAAVEGDATSGTGGDDLGVFVLGRNRDRPPRLFLVQPRVRPGSLMEAKLSEALNLANSLEDQRDGRYEEEFVEKKVPPYQVVQNPLARSRGRADAYFGPGTVETVKCHINSLDSEDGPDAIFVNAILSGIQQRNLERAWGKPVLDRVGLIIEIFNAHAETKEAKLQSELAALMYKRTRLVRMRGPGGRLTFGISGEAEVVSAKGKGGSGGRGFLSGAGESEIQLQRHRIQERRERLLHEIEEVRRTRALHRYARKRRESSQGLGLATVAVVGYTNAGKSTLVSALSQNDLYSDDRLFATVDPRLRSVVLPSGRKVLLSDTVGFISDLPVQLIEAFHATLEEVVDADLLVHVLDSSAKNLDEQRSTVLEVLKQIGVSDEKIENMIEVWNKIDLLEKAGPLGQEDDLVEDEGEEDFSDQEGLSMEGACEEQLDDYSVSEAEADEKSCKHGCIDSSSELGGSACSNLLSRVPTRDSDIDESLEVSSHSEQEDEADTQMSLQTPAYNDDLGSGLPFKERDEATSYQNGRLYRCQDFGELPTCVPRHARVETSAVTGIGLQEVLYIIDEKLTAQKPLQKTSIDYVDRKWRPSHTTEDERAAVH